LQRALGINSEQHAALLARYMLTRGHRYSLPHEITMRRRALRENQIFSPEGMFVAGPVVPISKVSWGEDDYFTRRHAVQAEFTEQSRACMFCSHAADFDTEEAYQAGYAKASAEIDALAAMAAGASDELGGMSVFTVKNDWQTCVHCSASNADDRCVLQIPLSAPSSSAFWTRARRRCQATASQ
jgi:hypothetical protein